MPIPNVSTLFKRINKGSEGGNEFARIVNLLLTAEFKECHLDFITFSDAQGDYKGVDSYARYTEARITGFQYKFYSSPLSGQHKYQIKKSLRNVFELFMELDKWIIITPEDLLKTDLSWLDTLKKEYEFNHTLDSMAKYASHHGQFPKRVSFSIEHWGHTKLVELFLKHPHIGGQYYPEFLYGRDSDGVELLKIGVDSKKCNWARFEDHENKFSQYPIYKQVDKGKTSDLILDFFFVNNSSKIHLLHSIEIKVVKVWSDIKGFPSDRVLKSLGIIEIEIDFDKEKTIYEFEDPLIFEMKQPTRFKVQLKDINKRMPGNCGLFNMNFNFSKFKLNTDDLYLSF